MVKCMVTCVDVCVDAYFLFNLTSPPDIYDNMGFFRMVFFNFSCEFPQNNNISLYTCIYAEVKRVDKPRVLGEGVSSLEIHTSTTPTGWKRTSFLNRSRLDGSRAICQGFCSFQAAKFGTDHVQIISVSETSKFSSYKKKSEI